MSRDGKSEREKIRFGEHPCWDKRVKFRQAHTNLVSQSQQATTQKIDMPFNATHIRVEEVRYHATFPTVEKQEQHLDTDAQKAVKRHVSVDVILITTQVEDTAWGRRSLTAHAILYRG